MANDLNDIRYVARNVSDAQTVKELARRLQDELRRIEQTLDMTVNGYVPELHVEPERPREGMIRFADGVNWNPGSRQGIYAYINGAWEIMTANTIIDYAHAKVHAGRFYSTGQIFNDVTAGESRYILISVGSTFELHAVFDAGAGGDAEFRIFDTVSASGTATNQLTMFNHKRSSANTVDAEVFHTPDISATGTELFPDLIPGGGFFGNGATAGGPIRQGTEVILDLDAKYLLKLTNTSGLAQDLSMALACYENTAT